MSVQKTLNDKQLKMLHTINDWMNKMSSSEYTNQVYDVLKIHAPHTVIVDILNQGWYWESDGLREKLNKIVALYRKYNTVNTN
jgi:Holliday junction resolvase-like predicted endonuclease